MELRGYDREKLHQEWERLGEREVRRRVLQNEYAEVGTPLREAVDEWLSAKETDRRLALEDRMEERAEETLSIARRALVNSRWANIIAIIATVIALAAIVIPVIKK